MVLKTSGKRGKEGGGGAGRLASTPLYVRRLTTENRYILYLSFLHHYTVLKGKKCQIISQLLWIQSSQQPTVMDDDYSEEYRNSKF